MYHSVSDDLENGVHPYYRVTTSPARFRQQMKWLRDAGFVGTSLTKALAAEARLQGGIRPVAITFDDGFRDFYTTAWPILQDCDFAATLYLPSAFICPTRKSYLGRQCLTWAEVRTLYAAGIEIGSHSVRHPVLHKMAWADIEHELRTSKVDIEDAVGAKVSGFAYPYAFPSEDARFTRRFVKELRASDYTTGVTTMIGRVAANDNRLLMKRMPINQCDDRELFIAKLSGAYDWMNAPQRLIRIGKACMRSRVRGSQ